MWKNPPGELSAGRILEECGLKGFTIGGARLRLSGDEAKDDTTQYKQMIRQMIAELEDVLVVLKK